MIRAATFGCLVALACDPATTTSVPSPTVAKSCPVAPASPLVLQVDALKVSAMQQAMQRGLVAVAFDCDEPTLIDTCAIDGRYELVRHPRIDVDKRFTSRADAEAASPLWGTSTPPLRIEPGEVLSLKLAVIGQARASASQVARADLQGSCAGVTHFVRTVHVGAYELNGTRGTTNHEAKGGILQECPADGQPPTHGCRTPLQLELVPIGP